MEHHPALCFHVAVSQKWTQLSPFHTYFVLVWNNFLERANLVELIAPIYSGGSITLF